MKTNQLEIEKKQQEGGLRRGDVVKDYSSLLLLLDLHIVW